MCEFLALGRKKVCHPWSRSLSPSPLYSIVRQPELYKWIKPMNLLNQKDEHWPLLYPLGSYKKSCIAWSTYHTSAYRMCFCLPLLQYLYVKITFFFTILIYIASLCANIWYERVKRFVIPGLHHPPLLSSSPSTRAV